MLGYPLGSGGNLVTTSPCTAPSRGGNPCLSSTLFLVYVKSSGKLVLISLFCSLKEIALTFVTIIEHSSATSLTLLRSSDLLPRIFAKTILAFVLPSYSTAFCRANFLISFFTSSSKLQTPFYNKIKKI